MAFKRPSVATTLVLILMTATVVDAVAQANKLKGTSDNPVTNSPQLRVIIPRSLGENGTDDSDDDHRGCYNNTNTTGCDHMDDHHGCRNFTNMMGCDHVDDNDGSNDTDTDWDEDHDCEDGPSPAPGGPDNVNLTEATSDLLAANSGVTLSGSGLVPALSICGAYFILG